MSLAAVIANVVSLANKVTASLQDQTVTLTAWIGATGSGTASYAAPVTLPALVDLSGKPIYGAGGALILTKAQVSFLAPIAPTTPNAGQVRQQPIDPRDVITLPDGTTGPIVLIEGLVNADTHKPFYSVVTVGK